MRTPIVLVCVFFAGTIQAADDAAQILKTTEQTYQNLTSYDFKGVTASETKVGKSISKTETAFEVAFKPPNEFLLEYDYPSAGTWARASDGKMLYNKRSITKEFSAQPVTADDVLMLAGSPIAPFVDLTKGIQNPSMAGSEALTIGGKNFDCYVIQFEQPSQSSSGASVAVPVKLWIDKTRHLILKQVSGSDEAPGSSKSTENQRTLSFSEVVVDASAVPDQLFHLSKPSKK